MAKERRSPRNGDFQIAELINGGLEAAAPCAISKSPN
jgi:hypothetical protein